MDINRVKSVVLVIIGILAISLSIRCYTFNTYGSEPCKYYDSKGEEILDYEESLSTGLASEADIQNVYTGIQNATADTSGKIWNLEKNYKIWIWFSIAYLWFSSHNFFIFNYFCTKK